jgi:hypothetical protein
VPLTTTPSREAPEKLVGARVHHSGKMPQSRQMSIMGIGAGKGTIPGETKALRVESCNDGSVAI